ncbi:MAG: hypothetical protein ACKVT2_03430 [Saprospiraceae bacterium]
MKKVITISSLAFSCLFFQSLNAQGPVIISGLDTEFGIRPTNASPASHGSINMWASVIQTGILNCVSNGSGATGGILVLGGGKNINDMVTDFWTKVGTALTPTRTVTFVNGTTNIQTASFSGYSMIVVVSTAANGVSGGLTFNTGSAINEHDMVCARANAIALFINSGGGFFASTSSQSSSTIANIAYGYFNVGTPALVSTLVGAINSTPTTPAGTSMGVLPVFGPYHNIFSSWPSFLTPLSTINPPPVSGLPPNQVCMLGGCRVLIPISSCCPGKNLIVNGDFQNNSGFISGYFNQTATPALNSVIPGQYAILNQGTAATVSPTWLVQDHPTCNSTDNFLVVNGSNGLSGQRLVWSQTIPVTSLKPNTQYRFCAWVRDLKQCAFNVFPDVELRILNPWYSASTVVNVTSSPICTWQRITTTVSIGPIVQPLTIQIWLNEVLPGDGNDLALDDISLNEMPPLPPAFSLFSVTTSNLTSSNYNITATPTTSLPTTGNCGYYWEVCQADNVGNCIIGTTFSNYPRWWTVATNFLGYTGTPGGGSFVPVGPPFAGIFYVGIRYKIRYGVWCECNSWSQSSFIFGYYRNASKKFKIMKVQEPYVEPPRPPIKFD